MRISIIIINYNGATFLGECIESVLSQSYPEKEIIVIDGGSSDSSLQIIEGYGSQLAFWLSEPDRGQSHAINKGLEKCTGEVVNWLCSDDRLEPNALFEIATAFSSGSSPDVVVGGCRLVYTDTGRSSPIMPTPRQIELIYWNNFIGQPSCFYKRTLLVRHPFVDENLHYVMDWELWMFFKNSGARFQIIPQMLSVYLWHGDNKTLNGGPDIVKEIDKVHAKYVGGLLPHWLKHFYFPLKWKGESNQNFAAKWLAMVLRRFCRAVLDLAYGRDRTDAKIQQYSFFLRS